MTQLPSSPVALKIADGIYYVVATGEMIYFRCACKPMAASVEGTSSTAASRLCGQCPCVMKPLLVDEPAGCNSMCCCNLICKEPEHPDIDDAGAGGATGGGSGSGGGGDRGGGGGRGRGGGRKGGADRGGGRGRGSGGGRKRSNKDGDDHDDSPSNDTTSRGGGGGASASGKRPRQRHTTGQYDEHNDSSTDNDEEDDEIANEPAVMASTPVLQIDTLMTPNRDNIIFYEIQPLRRPHTRPPSSDPGSRSTDKAGAFSPMTAMDVDRINWRERKLRDDQFGEVEMRRSPVMQAKRLRLLFSSSDDMFCNESIIS